MSHRLGLVCGLRGLRHREERPGSGDAFEAMIPAAVELYAGASDEVGDRTGDEQFVGLGESRDACADVDGDPSKRLPVASTFAGVDARADGQVVTGMPASSHCSGGGDGARGTVESDEETVAGRVDFAAAVSCDLAAELLAVLSELIAPSAADLRRALG